MLSLRIKSLKTTTMKLKVRIRNIKSIDNIEVALPVSKGLYAITGQNGSGKSTIVACASRAFFRMRMEDYFGHIEMGAYIECELNGTIRRWVKQESTSDNPSGWRHSSNGRMEIKGFYEGSLIYGNRFRNTSYEKIRTIETVKPRLLKYADDFIRLNMGEILHNDKDFYEKIWYVKGGDIGLTGGYVFYYEKNGKRISQFHMSTGENLLISILNSINIRNNDRDSIDKPCMFFLDEIELALHPSSLKKLVTLMKSVADEYNYAIYFSTHSIELISGIKPDNIFYIERHTDNSLEIINPCYPAYATKFLYDHSGYDKVILVEDDLAKDVINRILQERSMRNNKLIHILPAGGWFNVLKLADDVIKNNLLGKRAAISVVLDKDIVEDSKKHIVKYGYNSSIPIGYLPISSLEKYLKCNLVESVNHKLHRLLTDYIFMQKSLSEIVEEYKKTKEFDWTKDNNGKKFYYILDTELRARGKDRSHLLELVVKFLFENEQENIEQIVTFLQEQLE